jgi:hypothetical protein
VSLAINYRIMHRGEEVAAAVTMEGALLALETLAEEMPAPWLLSAVSVESGREVAWVRRDGGVGRHEQP